jgi:hypothetical protein
MYEWNSKSKRKLLLSLFYNKVTRALCFAICTTITAVVFMTPTNIHVKLVNETQGIMSKVFKNEIL